MNMKILTHIVCTMVFIYPVLSLASPEAPKIIFQDYVCIKPFKNYTYQTCHPITVTIDHFIVQIPTDFQTDLASIPRWLWLIIAPTHSAIMAPAVLHDYLYACHNGYVRQEADDIFYAALITNGVSTFKAYEMYAAVRLLGRSHFNEENNCYKHLANLKK